MKQRWKKSIAYIMSFCMLFGIMQTAAWEMPVYAETADGEVDESQEGVHIVRYLTGELGKQFTDTDTSPESHTDRLTDFIAETQSMTWSVEFQTTDTKLQSLLALENSGNYLAFYLKDGNKIGFEAKNPASSGVETVTSFSDGNWHKAEFEIIKGEAAVIRLDDTEVKRVENPVCISDLAWSPAAFTIGGMNHYTGKGGWHFNGKLRNVVCSKTVSLMPNPVWEQVNLADSRIQTGQSFQEGSIHMTYRLKEAFSDRVTVLTVGDSEIYVNPSTKKLGLKAGSVIVEQEAPDIHLGTAKWHNLTLTKEADGISFYLDGEALGNGSFSGTFDVSAIQKGESVYGAKTQLYDSVLTPAQISELHMDTKFTSYPDPTEKLEGYYKGENREIFNAGFDGSVAYRIPAIATSKKTGTVIASIDKRWITNADTGINDTVVRRSEDNGETRQLVIPAIDMQDDCAYTIDPEIVVDNDPQSPHYGRVYILVGMVRRGVSLWGAQAGTGYKKINGKDYQILLDEDENEYTVRENGIVYDSEGNKTEYQVETRAEAPYTDMGRLYKSGEYIGSIYKGDAELSMVNTYYLWMTYSDDDGVTWSLPKDLNPMVKADWMTFFGTGPGAGAQLQSGRLIFTMYCMTSANQASHFSSYNVYTDDHGKTWHRGASPNDISETENATNSTRELNESCIVELDNGHLIQFMKNSTPEVAMAVSVTQGESWGEVTYAQGIREVYCEMSVVHYGDLFDPADGQTKEAIIFANPTGNGRNHGRVRIAFVNEDDTLDWAYDKLIEEKNFLYTSLTVMENGMIGLIYENEKGDSTAAAFTSFSPQYIMDPNRYENTPQPSAIEVAIFDASGAETDALVAGNKLYIEVEFDDVVFAAGNVTLNVLIGDQTKEAALIGNVNENTLAFSYPIRQDDNGIVTALAEVNVKEGGVAETIYNVRLTDKPFVTKTVRVGKISAEGFAELPTAGMTATAGSAHSDGAAQNVLDGNIDTLWHTNYGNDEDKASNGGRPKHWITIDLGGSYLVSGLQYTPRKTVNPNGTITEYQIEISTDGETFYPYERGEWKKDSAVKTVYFTFAAAAATHVRLRALETKDDFASAAEIRIIGKAQDSGAVNRLELAQEVLNYGDKTEMFSELYPEFSEAVETAKELLEDSSVSQQQLDAAFGALQTAKTQSFQTIDDDLAAAIADKNTKVPEDYNITSWAAYRKACEAVENLSGETALEEKLKLFLNLKEVEKNLVKLNVALVEHITVLSKDDVRELEAGSQLQLSAEIEPEDAANQEVDWNSGDPKKASVDENGLVTAIEEGDVTITAEAKDGSGITGDITLKITPEPTTDPKKPVTKITVTSKDGQKELTIEDTLQLLAEIEPEDATNQEVDWSSSDPKKASVDENGLVTAIEEGDVAITAEAKDGSGITGNITLKIQAKQEENPEKPVESVRITAAGNKTKLQIQEQVKLTAVVMPWDATNKKVVWASSKPSIASVDTNGNVKALRAGKTTITARPADGKGGVSGSIGIEVLPRKVTGITVTAAENRKTLTVNETVKLTASVKPTDAANKKVSWSSGNSNIASVDANGNVKAKAIGAVVITAKALDGSNVKGSITLKVEQGLPEAGEIFPIENRNYKIIISSATEKTAMLLKSLKNTKKKVSIKPSVSIEGQDYKITVIGEKAFQKDKKMTQVTIGSNVTKIGKNAFANCSKLKKIVIVSDKITKIYKNAFKGIKKNAQIIVPKKKLKRYKFLLKKAKLPKSVKVKSK